MIAAIEEGKISVDESYFASSGDTPLWWAVILNNLELATYLLEKGANVNFVQAKYLVTPLHAAARRGLSEMCLLLLKHGADINAIEKHGKTPAQYMCHSRCKAVHSLSDEVKKAIGFTGDVGAYAPEEPDLKFWGKYGPPAKLSAEEEAKFEEEQKQLMESLTAKK